MIALCQQGHSEHAVCLSEVRIEVETVLRYSTVGTGGQIIRPSHVYSDPQRYGIERPRFLIGNRRIEAPHRRQICSVPLVGNRVVWIVCERLTKVSLAGAKIPFELCLNLCECCARLCH